MEKLFKFDVILEEADMCNRDLEKCRLLSIMERNGRVVIYSPRRMGKTTLATVCSNKLKTKQPETFVLYVDLNELSSLSEVAERFRSHYEASLREQFPVQKAKMLLSSLLSRVKIGLPGGTSVAVEKYTIENPENYLISLFGEVREMAKSRPTVIVADEFQGIAELKNAQAVLRREFQGLQRTAVVLMGSNQRLLYHMLNDKKLPFFGFGEDIELNPISVTNYLPYMNKRFAKSNLHISKESAEHLMGKTNNIPNYINELGAWIVDNIEGVELTIEHIDLALEAAAKSKRGRYESILYGYSHNQRCFLKALARLERGTPLTGKEMQFQTGFLSPVLTRIKETLENCPLLCRDTSNYLFIIDPFLKKYLEIM